MIPLQALRGVERRERDRPQRRLVLVATGTGTLMVPADPRVLARMATPRRYRDRDYGAAVAGSIYGGAFRHDPSIGRRFYAGQRPAVATASAAPASASSAPAAAPTTPGAADT